MEKGKRMIKLNVEPYCENCRSFDPKATSDMFSMKSTDTVVTCKNATNCAYVAWWVLKHGKEMQISID